MAMADAASAVPTQDDKARYETLKKELMQALPKKRAIDKQLVRLYPLQTLAHSNFLPFSIKGGVYLWMERGWKSL